jgi:hypothetical protein
MYYYGHNILCPICEGRIGWPLYYDYSLCSTDGTWTGSYFFLRLFVEPLSMIERMKYITDDTVCFTRMCWQMF